MNPSTADNVIRITRIGATLWVLHYPYLWNRDPKVSLQHRGKALIEVDRPANVSWVAWVTDEKVVAAAKALALGESKEVTV